MRRLLSANKVVPALLFALAACGTDGSALAAVDTYCTAYATEAAYRKTGTDKATVITRGRPITKSSDLTAGTDMGAPDRKWEQAYASAFASCMAKYASEDMIETASTGAAAKETKPPLEVKPKPKFELRIEKQKANRVTLRKAPQTKPSASKRSVVERPPLKTNITAKPNSSLSEH